MQGRGWPCDVQGCGALSRDRWSGEGKTFLVLSQGTTAFSAPHPVPSPPSPRVCSSKLGGQDKWCHLGSPESHQEKPEHQPPKAPFPICDNFISVTEKNMRDNIYYTAVQHSYTLCTAGRSSTSSGSRRVALKMAHPDSKPGIHISPSQPGIPEHCWTQPPNRSILTYRANSSPSTCTSAQLLQDLDTGTPRAGSGIRAACRRELTGSI